MYTKGDMFEQFLAQGFVRVNDPTVFTEINIENLQWKDCCVEELCVVHRDTAVELAIQNTQKILGEKYVSIFDENYTLGSLCDIVDDIDDGSFLWHNDLIEGFNLCILLYFDTMDKDIGGAISFRPSDTEYVETFYPKSNDILIINHSKRFQHRVSPLNMMVHRRVASFNYNINWDLTR